MDNLEVTRLCAEAMDVPVYIGPWETGWVNSETGEYYRPLRDDAQAMALVKKFTLRVDRTRGIPEKWGAYSQRNYGDMVICDDLNRAICECVAKMQAAK